MVQTRSQTQKQQEEQPVVDVELMREANYWLLLKTVTLPHAYYVVPKDNLVGDYVYFDYSEAYATWKKKIDL